MAMNDLHEESKAITKLDSKFNILIYLSGK